MALQNALQIFPNFSLFFLGRFERFQGFKNEKFGETRFRGRFIGASLIGDSRNGNYSRARSLDEEIVRTVLVSS
jgi:hypothetical protein